MKIKLSILICLVITTRSFSQIEKSKYLGVNILQLTASTININYSLDVKPFITSIIDIGYTFNYKKAINTDLVGTLLTPHLKYEDGYYIDKQSGGYLKVGGFLNLRKEFERKNYFHLGFFITNSIVHEAGKFMSPEDSRPLYMADKINQTVFICGLSISAGYELSIFERLKSSLDFQISVPSKKYIDLFGYENYIPGMGYKDAFGRWFPMLIMNIKYRL